MSTRSIVDETGELVSVIVDVTDYKCLIEAHMVVAEAAGSSKRQFE